MNRICKNAIHAYTSKIRRRLADYPEDTAQRVAMYTEMVLCLGAFGVRVMGHLGESLVVSPNANTACDLWTVCDNGGELNVEKINDGESLRSVPYRSARRGKTEHGATMAYRVDRVLRGAVIDYSLECKEAAETLRANQGPNK